jgi:hypothetical protein
MKMQKYAGQTSENEEALKNLPSRKPGTWHQHTSPAKNNTTVHVEYNICKESV